jgi:hypothetical protein
MQVEAYINVNTIYFEIDIDDDDILEATSWPESAGKSLETIVEEMARHELDMSLANLREVRHVSEITVHETVIHSHIPNLVEEFEESYPEVKERHL